MDFDQLVLDTFGSDDLSALPPERIVAGVAQLRERLADEPDPDDRFAVWCLLRMLHAAPDPDEAFADADDRDAAHEFAAAIDGAD